jgi:beta-glucosidase
LLQLSVNLKFNNRRDKMLLPYKDPSLPTEKRVEDLLSRMTIEEKFWQLFMSPGELGNDKEKFKHGIFGLQTSTESTDEQAQILKYSSGIAAKETAIEINRIQKYFIEETRLGIPIIPFDEALHGLIRKGATAFPQSIGLAATFNTEMMKRVSAAIAKEVKTRGIRDVLSPVINIARDIRWGRVEETYGEDTFLTAEMGTAFVKSFEDMGVITTPKHISANVGDGGRDSYPIHFNERLLNEIYFPAFRACIDNGNSRSIMTCYNSLDGQPCSSNKWLLKKTLKEKWGFKGFVISDASAVGGILDLHHVVNTREESAKVSIESGLDVIFQGSYDHHIPLLKAFKEGMVNEDDINDAVSRILTAKFELGLFENPYVNPDEAEKWNGHEDHRKLAFESARESIVLLKNEGNILPLNKNINSIAVIGVDAVEARLGGYSGPGINKVSIYDGIKNKLGDKVRLEYAEGCGREEIKYVTIPDECLFSADGKPGLKGEYFGNTDLSGTPKLIRNDKRIDFGWTLFPPDESLDFDCYSIRWTGKLKPSESGIYQIGIAGDDGYKLYIDGKPVIDNWKKQSYDIKTIPFKFEKSKEYDIRIEFFENLGNARFRLIWNIGIPDISEKINESKICAEKCDVSVIVTGIEEGEFRDRANIALPGRQEEMIRKISELGKPVIIVIIGGSAITMSNWIDNVSTIIDSWYPGEEGGNAIADVLFGDYNPAGRLPVTFPLSVAQLPLYYNHKPTGRGDDYLDLTGKPAFPFGFGLSYTEFEYSDFEINPPKIKSGESARVKFNIKNTGKITGDEVPQLYIRDMVASVVRPVMELKGFKRVSLSPGETKTVSFEIKKEHLSMFNENMEEVIEPGEFKIMIGSSSRDIKLRGIMSVIE